MTTVKPWASFCMSTYNRPAFLKIQIETLLKQTFKNFEIVISDNDPEASGKSVADAFCDNRVKYFCNGENLGMVKSYNNSIDRAEGEFIVMVTDDDPVYDSMLEFFNQLSLNHPNYSIYCGLKRNNTDKGFVEIVDKENVLLEILDPKRTIGLHWSSCLLKKATLLEIGKLTDYGSGHLVDHIMIVLAGSKNGAVIINQEFSEIQYHQGNYSKANVNNYYLSCIGFYSTLTNFFKDKPGYNKNYRVIIKHLHHWFIVCFFSLRKFYTLKIIDNVDAIKELDFYSDKIMAEHFMKKCKFLYSTKKYIFFVKKKLGLLK